MQHPPGCVSPSYCTRQAGSYRLKGQLNDSLPQRWTLSPSPSWGQDVYGFSVDNQPVQGRKPHITSLAAQYPKRYFATRSHTNWADNAAYDLLQDDADLSVAVGAHF